MNKLDLTEVYKGTLDSTPVECHFLSRIYERTDTGTTFWPQSETHRNGKRLIVLILF